MYSRTLLARLKHDLVSNNFSQVIPPPAIPAKHSLVISKLTVANPAGALVFAFALAFSIS